jgi:hypothetical protein
MRLTIITLIVILFCSFSLLAQPRQTDREFDGLKGSVKTILTERADAKQKGRKLIESNRRNVEFVSYDAKGSRLARKAYHWISGELFESDIYKVIDGDKVSVSEEVDSPDKIIAAAPVGTVVKPFDSRYDFKLKNKYDANGKVIEEAWWRSDGDLWLRYTYKTDGIEREELVFSAGGSMNQRYKFILDGKGNDIEMMAYDTEKGSIEGKEKYEYLAFDAKGNWTKRIEFQGDKESKFVYKPREVKYRTITYF